MSSSPDPPDVALSLLALRLSDAVVRLRRALHREQRSVLPAAQLSPVRLELLRMVSRQPGIGVVAVAERLGAASNTISALITELVRAGLLTRLPVPDDHRSVALHLSARGTALIHQWEAHTHHELVRSLDALDPAQRSLLAAALPVIDELGAALHQAARTATRTSRPRTPPAPPTGQRFTPTGLGVERADPSPPEELDAS